MPAPDPIEDAIDTKRFPLDTPDSAVLSRVVEAAHEDLRRGGCAVLRGFLRPDAVQRLAAQAQGVLGEAHVNDILSNPYSTSGDPSLPPDHPVNVFMERTNAFVPKAAIPEHHLVRRLYHCDAFRVFVARCLERPAIHEYADPLAALVLNLLRPGAQHPWHYDTNEFIVSTLVQAAEAGGEFEYCPQIRSPQGESYERVGRVLRDEDRTEVRRLQLQPGDLQIFRGRFSLHRVTRVAGSRPRITAIFAYAETPGMVGKVERTRQLFGRVTADHLAAARQPRRDALVD